MKRLLSLLILSALLATGCATSADRAAGMDDNDARRAFGWDAGVWAAKRFLSRIGGGNNNDESAGTDAAESESD